MNISSKIYVKDESGFLTKQGYEPDYYPLQARFGREFYDDGHEALYKE